MNECGLGRTGQSVCRKRASLFYRCLWIHNKVYEKSRNRRTIANGDRQRQRQRHCKWQRNSSSSAAARKLRRGIVCAQYSVIIVITAGPILAADDYPLTKLRGRKEINRKLKVICQFSNGTMDWVRSFCLARLKRDTDGGKCLSFSMLKDKFS